MTSSLRRVLVTGGCGYLGSQLLRHLAQDPDAGVAVRILDNMQEQNVEALMDLPDGGRFEFVEGDILDPAAVRLALRGVDAVVHLAAVVRTPISFDQPVWLEQVNHWGTAHLVEACLSAGVRRFVYASSAAVYGPGGVFTEESACRPQGPYAQSKLRGEESVRAAEGRGLEATILRLGTAYGHAPVMRFDAVANRFVYLAGVRRPLTVFGEGTQRRPLIHVRDAARLLAYALAHPERTRGQLLNGVTDNPTVLELAEAITLADGDAEVRFTERNVLTHLSMEVDGRAALACGWRPEETLRDGMAELLGHFRALEPATASFDAVD